MNIHLRIERLVLDGLPIPGEMTRLLQSALERELASLLAKESALSVRGRLPSLSAPAVQLSENISATSLGGQIARSLHATLAQSPPEARVANQPGATMP